MKLISQFEGGKLYRTPDVNILVLTGTYRQMGRQYGYLLKNEMNSLYDAAVNREFINRQGFQIEKLQIIAASLFDVYPQRLKNIIYGMAETSGLGLEKQIILNAIEFYPKINHVASNCSAIAAWGNYASGGQLIFGRNNDDYPYYKDFAKSLTVAVFNSSDMSIPVATINYPGVVYASNGMNSAGIFLELNSGPWTKYYLNRLSVFVTLFSFLQDFSSMRQIDFAFKSTQVNIPSIINIADRNIAYCYECPTFGIKRRTQDNDGLMVATNHFVDPLCEIEQENETAPADSVKRRDNLLALGETYKGRIDVENMKRILDTPLDRGGATSPSDTIYQIIAVPSDLSLWIKSPGNFDWEEIELKSLFAKMP